MLCGLDCSGPVDCAGFFYLWFGGWSFSVLYCFCVVCVGLFLVSLCWC